MAEQRTVRSGIWTPLIVSIVLVIGMALGFNLRDRLRSKRDIQTVIERNDRLEEIIDLIHEKYVDTVNSNALYQDAVNGILKHLDPHTVYIPADEAAEANEDLEGGFFGIGVEFSIIRDTIQFTSVIENGPAEHAGIEVGDELIKVGDSVVAGTHITSERIVKMLKGKQRSRIIATVKKGWAPEQKQVTIVRDVVPIYSVDAGIKADSITGYIKINRFSATTYREFSDALKRLKTEGVKQMILDLRDNPGGYLDAATMIADEFLDDNKLIVYTLGLHAAKTEYKAGQKGMFESGRLAVLVDENSASAAEILTGAMQDWDRGVVIGRRTFGKGLVQEQYDMDDGAALRLTIAKYYTPSGRCIQRSFAKGREAYEQDFEKRYTDGDLTGYDTTAIADTTKYYTAAHRLVYGGGGIKPDIYVPYDTAGMSVAVLNMAFSDELKVALWDYFIHNRKELKYEDVRDFDRQFKGQDAIVKNYLGTLPAKERGAAAKLLAKPTNANYFKTQIKAQMARFLFRDNGYYAISIKDDNVVQKALQVLHSNSYSSIIGGK